MDVDPYIRDRARATRGAGSRARLRPKRKPPRSIGWIWKRLEHRNTVTDFNLPRSTFFDTGMVHVLTAATLNRLHEFYREGFFATPRFRPNVVVRTPDSSHGFVEDTWLGRTIAIGERVHLKIDLNCARCVMTTLAQGDLAKDPGILSRRSAAQPGECRRVRIGTARRHDSARRLSLVGVSRSYREYYQQFVHPHRYIREVRANGLVCL